MKSVILFILCLFLTFLIFAQNDEFTIHYALSRFNEEAIPREKTIGIINHDTQGDWPGCRTWLQCINYGPPMANYLINRVGYIELICDDWREADHAGDSYVDGQRDVSRFYLSFEYVGYWTMPLTDIQERAGKWLTDSMKRKYPDIKDINIIPHAAAACWYPEDPKNPHPGFYTRGRRSDGIRFIDPKMMEEMGITERRLYDIDQVTSDSVYASDAHNKRCYGRTFSKDDLLAIRKSLIKRDTASVDPINMFTVVKISTEQFEVHGIVNEPVANIEEYYSTTPQVSAILPKRKYFFKNLFLF